MIEGTREKLKKSKVKNTLTKPIHEHGVKTQRRRITKRLSWLHFNHWALGSSVVVGESLGRRKQLRLDNAPSVQDPSQWVISRRCVFHSNWMRIEMEKCGYTVCDV